jgi:hypothetical protein
MASMDNDIPPAFIVFHETLGNLLVIIAVATVVAGPILGLWGLRFHELMMQAGSRHMAVGALFSCDLMPAMTVSQLIANPGLSLTDHREQAMWGLLIGFLVLVGGGIALALDNRHRRTKGER